MSPNKKIITRRIGTVFLSLVGLYLLVFTILVSPDRFFQCIEAPINYFTRNPDSITGIPQAEFVTGNHVRLLVNGNEALPVMLNLINTAKYSIRWQVMYFHSGQASLALANALKEAALRGVTVQLSFDKTTSANGPVVAPNSQEIVRYESEWMEVNLKQLSNAGVIFINNTAGVDYNLIDISENARSIQQKIAETSCIGINHYDHRKILILDDRLAVIGGMNVGNQYLYTIAPDISLDQVTEAANRQKERQSEAYEKWQDVSVLIEGPLIEQIIAEFNWRWEVIGGKPLPPSPAKSFEEGVSVKFLPQRPGLGAVGAGYIELINQAQDAIIIANPYVSYPPLINALIIAQKRGVQVSFIFPYQYNDQTVSKRVFEPYANQLINNGIKLYYDNNRMIHSKVMVVDGRWSVIGSFNLNYRSFTQDLEVAVVIDNADFAKEVQQRVFNPYLQYSTPMTSIQKQQWWDILIWIVQPFS